MERISLDGRSHWCAHGSFTALRGIDQGFIRSIQPSNAWSGRRHRAFSPYGHQPFDVRRHSAKAGHSPAGRYRSATYIFVPDRRGAAAQTIEQHAQQLGEAARTFVVRVLDFRESDERYRNYYRINPNRPFC